MRSYIGGAIHNSGNGAGSFSATKSGGIVLIIVGCIIVIVLLVFICKKCLCNADNYSDTYNEHAAELERSYPDDPLSQTNPVATVGGILKSQTSLDIIHNKNGLNTPTEMAAPHPVVLSPLHQRINDEKLSFISENSTFRQSSLQDTCNEHAAELERSYDDDPLSQTNPVATVGDILKSQTSLDIIHNKNGLNATTEMAAPHPVVLSPLQKRINDEKLSFISENSTVRQSSLQEPLPSKSRERNLSPQISTMSVSYMSNERI